MKIKTWQIIAIIICLILGILLHFTYEWSGGNTVVGIFSAVNESTWEHLKLTFYPMLLMAMAGYFVIGKKTNNYWVAQATGILVAIAFIAIFFYAYTGILGLNSAVFNIGLFVVSVILGENIIYKILMSQKDYNAESISIVFLILLLLLFIIYTFNPPQIPLFKDHLTNTYGINDIVK